MRSSNAKPGRGDKLPLAIAMLYQAIKAQRWETRMLESL
jgi:hypothetical protein